MSEQMAIEAQGLSKRYGRATAVNNLSFQVPRGQITGFLGPNGAGKTTTMRMLAGLIRPSSGSSRLLGASVPGSSLLEVGTMIEEPSFYPYMSGRRNLEHAARLHGGVPEGRIQEVLNFVHMDQAADKKVGAYSQGMRQRLGLARAILWQPQVLLLDEPTNGLDPVGIAEIRESLRQIAAQGVTILISSHILAELEKLVERVLVIERGTMLFDGPLSTLVRQLEENTVSYLLRADNMEQLSAALVQLGLPVDDSGKADWTATRVPAERAASLLGELSAAGVRILEAMQQQESLEHAYLRLLREDGRPA